MIQEGLAYEPVVKTMLAVVTPLTAVDERDPPVMVAVLIAPEVVIVPTPDMLPPEIVTPLIAPEVVKVPTPDTLLESSTKTALFCTSFPVVPSNLTTALSVDEAGPVTSPPPQPAAATAISPALFV